MVYAYPKGTKVTPVATSSIQRKQTQREADMIAEEKALGLKQNDAPMVAPIAAVKKPAANPADAEKAAAQAAMREK